jgi:hypothetical protein
MSRLIDQSISRAAGVLVSRLANLAHLVDFFVDGSDHMLGWGLCDALLLFWGIEWCVQNLGTGPNLIGESDRSIGEIGRCYGRGGGIETGSVDCDGGAGVALRCFGGGGRKKKRKKKKAIFL